MPCRGIEVGGRAGLDQSPIERTCVHARTVLRCNLTGNVPDRMPACTMNAPRCAELAEVPRSVASASRLGELPPVRYDRAWARMMRMQIATR